MAYHDNWDTQDKYYGGGTYSFTGDASTLKFTLTKDLNDITYYTDQFNPNPTISPKTYKIYIDGTLYAESYIDSSGDTITNYEIKWDTALPMTTDGWYVEFDSAPADGASIKVYINQDNLNEKWGSYQFVRLEDIISNFMIVYTGEDKVIPKASKVDVAFHAQRALAELSFDTFKSCKSQEIEIPATLTMILPHDYVNYVKLSWKDSAGIQHVLYPTSKTSNPKAIKQNTDGSYSFDINDDGIPDVDNLIYDEDSDTWGAYKSHIPAENINDYDDNDAYCPHTGQRYCLDPQHAQVNGSFFIDCDRGKIHFSSNLSGKTVILEYISDSLGTEAEMQVHKFAEEAMYKSIIHGIISSRINTPEHVIQRFKKEKFAETRKAKLRLSNIKLEEITQILRGKSKQIKH